VLHAADVLLLQKEFRLHVDRAADGRRADVPEVDDQLWWEGEARPPMMDLEVWRRLRVPEPKREDALALLEKTSVKKKLEALREGFRAQRSSRSNKDEGSRTRTSSPQHEFAFLRLVDYRPPWEAFRLNGVYDDFYAVLWKDQSVTWEPGQFLRSHLRECARAVERWLELYKWHEGLGAEKDPAPAWVPQTAAEMCEPDEADGEPPRAEASWSPTRAEVARLAVWGSLVEAKIPVATWVYASSGECKRRKVTCHRSRADPALFYCWNPEGSLHLSQLRNAMISRHGPQA